MKFFRIALPLLSLLWISPALAQLNVLTNYQTTTGPVQVSSSNPLPVTGSFSAATTATASATLPSVSPGPAAALYENLSGALFTQPSFNGTLVDSTHGLPVNIVAGATSGVAQGTAYSAQTFTPVMGLASTNAPTATTGDLWGLSISPASGGVRIDLKDTASNTNAFLVNVASGGIASGAIASGALATGSGTDGWDVTQGAKADTTCATATGTCSLIALVKYQNTAINSAVPVTLNGTATGLTGLTPGSAQTGTIVAANVDITSLHGTALSAASLPVTVASGGIASGGIASGAIASGAVATGAFASGSIGSGAVASGAIASGALASGSIAAGAVSAGAYVSGSVLSGAFASGSLASGAMVDLITFQGTKAAGTAAANSLLTGGVYSTSLPGPTNGQQTATQLDNLGRVITAPPSILSSKIVNGTTAAMTGTSSTSVVALVSSQRLYIMAVHCTNSSANATLVLLQDGSAGTTLDTLVCPAGGGDERNGGGFPLFYTTAGNALYAQDVTTSASVIVQASGFSSAN